MTCAAETLTATLGANAPLRHERRLGAGLPDHPAVELLPQSDRLRDAEKRAGQNDAVSRAAPAYERFEAGAAVLPQIDAGLIEQLELVPLERRAQVALEAASLRGFRLHLGREQAELAPTFFLGAIEREVGCFDQRFRRCAMLGKQGDASARREQHGLAAQLERPRQSVEQLARQYDGGARVADRGLHDGKLVAAEPGNHIAGAKAVAQPFAHRAQQPVADQVTERIVDPLEAVQVQQQHGDLALIAPRLPQRVLQMILEQGAVRQIGQRIVLRQVAGLLLGALALRDVPADRLVLAEAARLVEDPAIGPLVPTARSVGQRDLELIADRGMCRGQRAEPLLDHVRLDLRHHLQVVGAEQVLAAFLQ